MAALVFRMRIKFQTKRHDENQGKAESGTITSTYQLNYS